MRRLFILALFLSIYSRGQLSYNELIKMKVYSSISDAETSSEQVIRLQAFDFNTENSGAVLSNFPMLQVLDLQGAKLEYMPLGIKKLEKLEYLNLSNTDIQFVYGVIKKMKNLKEIGLVNTKVSSKEIKKIALKLGIKVVVDSKNLSEVYISKTEKIKPKNEVVKSKLTQTSDLKSISNASTLSELNNRYKLKTYKTIQDVKPGEESLVETLSIDATGFKKFLNTINLYKNLYALDLFMVPYVPECINELKKLKALTVHLDPTGETIPFPNLENLNLLIYESFYPHKNIPIWLKKSKSLLSLKIITANENVISELNELKLLEQISIELPYSEKEKMSVGLKSTKGIEKFTSLKELHLESNQKITVDKEIHILKHLKIFDIKNNNKECDIESLPQSFGELINLEVFRADVRELPKSFNNLINLKEFGRHNFNGSLTLGVENLTRLENIEKLYLKLKTQTFDLSKLKFLKVLKLEFVDDVHMNQMGLVSGLQEIKGLNSIELINCRLDALTYNSITKNIGLNKLIINSCRLKSLIPSIQQLDRLEILDIKNNSINYLPEFLWEMPMLKKVVLFGNPIYMKDREKCMELENIKEK